MGRHKQQGQVDGDVKCFFYVSACVYMCVQALVCAFVGVLVCVCLSLLSLHVCHLIFIPNTQVFVCVHKCVLFSLHVSSCVRRYASMCVSVCVCRHVWGTVSLCLCVYI